MLVKVDDVQGQEGAELAESLGGIRRINAALSACIKSQLRASAKLLWRAVEASKCRYSEMKAAVGGR